jgi:hypothetical protein
MHILDLAEYVCQLYRSPFNTIEKTRWYLFSKKQQQDSAFPPTKSTLYFHIQRAHYQAKIWKKSTKPTMQLDDPCDAGWKIIGNKHQSTVLEQHSILMLISNITGKFWSTLPKMQ